MLVKELSLLKAQIRQLQSYRPIKLYTNIFSVIFPMSTLEVVQTFSSILQALCKSIEMQHRELKGTFVETK